MENQRLRRLQNAQRNVCKIEGATAKDFDRLLKEEIKKLEKIDQEKAHRLKNTFIESSNLTPRYDNGYF